MAYDDEEDEGREARAVRIIRESREIVRRHKRETEKRRDELERQSPADVAHTLLPTAEDPGAKWRREMGDIAAAREAAKAEIASPAPFDWSAFDDRIQAAIEVERQFLCETLGAETGRLLARERTDVMREAREELRELKIEAAKLGSEIAELRAQLAVDRGKPVDMPSPLSRRVN